MVKWHFITERKQKKLLTLRLVNALNTRLCLPQSPALPMLDTFNEFNVITIS